MSVAKLSHPNILSIFEFAHDGPTAFVVMELVEGETLRARLALARCRPGGRSRTRCRLHKASRLRTHAASRTGI